MANQLLFIMFVRTKTMHDYIRLWLWALIIVGYFFLIYHEKNKVNRLIYIAMCGLSIYWFITNLLEYIYQ